MPHAELPNTDDQILAEKARIEGITRRLWLVQSISLSRLLAALLFASLAFQNLPIRLLACIYGFAMCSDLVDGFLARWLNTESYAGKVFDLVSDKSLTIVSLLYAAERGVCFLPLALIAIREIIVIGLRLIIIDGTQLLPTSRIFGGIMALLLWSNTLFLVFMPKDSDWVQTANHIYLMCALVFATNLTVRIYMSRRRIMASITKGE
jgi:phosphatidylglycerophosphate synthase